MRLGRGGMQVATAPQLPLPKRPMLCLLRVTSLTHTTTHPDMCLERQNLLPAGHVAGHAPRRRPNAAARRRGPGPNGSGAALGRLAVPPARRAGRQSGKGAQVKQSYCLPPRMWHLWFLQFPFSSVWLSGAR